MLASGLPEKTEVHAKNIALVALDMMDIAQGVVVDDYRVKVRLGSIGREQLCHSQYWLLRGVLKCTCNCKQILDEVKFILIKIFIFKCILMIT